MRNKIVTILFCLMLSLGLILHLVTADRYYSEHEKRTLKQFPKITWTKFRQGQLGDEIEDYLADQFPSRDNWVTVKTLSDRLAGKKESGGVYFASDGYLIEIHKDLFGKQMIANLNAVSALQKDLDKEGKGITFRLMLVPTAGNILSEKLPAFAENADEKAVIECAKELGIRIVDVTETLESHQEEYIYYKTDHHWTSLGAYYAYAEWMREKGMEPVLLSSLTKEELCSNFRGTTYAKVNDPFASYDMIDAYYGTISHKVEYNGGSYTADSIYERKYLNGTDQYAVFFNSNQATTAVSGEGEGRLLILKDSYANSFAQFCVDDYEQTHMIDLRFYRGSVQKYIEENEITEVLVLYNIPNFAADTGITRCDK